MDAVHRELGTWRSVRFVTAIALVAMVIGGVCTGWWMTGDLSESGEDLMYMVRPPSFALDEAPLIGLFGMTVVLAGGVALALTALKASWSQRWLYAVLSLVASSVGFGFSGRVLTAGVASGANIGGGLVIVFVLPVLTALMVAGYLQCLALRRAAALSEAR